MKTKKVLDLVKQFDELEGKRERFSRLHDRHYTK